MCMFITVVGILLNYFYEKTECIWVPSILHGAMNAAATLPLMLTDKDMVSYVLGPTLAGLLAGISLYTAAVVIFAKVACWKGKKDENRK